ncbi:hypothetical protein JM83_1123 [Gillisia sp. Hel_I_86]|uniref:hypothetical protein n=1 Tax=Gillisia sp. Hel_I_86 TaxID=1249981 RepID=UPI001199350A|nr:hypothetical protein [Gillisia sp. Hel_I_86]TVZ26170.1 hypothetical protein JM83_1123 [Gillisia sp. Hel_I_86]
MSFSFVFLFFIVSAASCQNTDEAQNVSLQDLEQQLEALQAFVDQSNCTQNSQCSYIAYGTKACGGPKGYLVFSTNVDMDQLKVMVAKYSKAEATYNKQNGIISDCSIPAPPQSIKCSDGKCIAVD